MWRRGALLAATAGAVLLALLAAADAQMPDQSMGPAGCPARPKVQKPCPRWSGTQMANPADLKQPYDLDPQEIPCFSKPDMKDITDSAFRTPPRNLVRLYPGNATTCGHGNREFSFFAREGSAADGATKIIIVFPAGGMCWDALTCGLVDISKRTLSIDSRDDPAGPPPAVINEFMRTTDGPLRTGFIDHGNAQTNSFASWTLVVIPDCTGDLSIGNRSYTYAPNDATQCITTHHRGGVNAAAAIEWTVRNFPRATNVLLAGTGSTPRSKAVGAHGAAFWAPYVQKKLPGANVRAVVDSSFGILGPQWSTLMQADPWGTAKLMMPDMQGTLLPPPTEWSIANDDLSSFYEYAARTSPGVAFADVSSTDDMFQTMLFQTTGGKLRDCCLNGCSCNFGTTFGISAGAPPSGMRGGALDWTKTRKVTVLRRLSRLPNNYRSWLHTGESNYWLISSLYATECALPAQCTGAYSLNAWLFGFATGVSQFSPEGDLTSTTLPGSLYQDRAFGPFTCDGCLDGVLGSRAPGDEMCNATLGDAETLFTVAPAYGTDWMALWSLNGWDAPDIAATGTTYRWGHEYHVREGESLMEIAARFGTSVDRLVRLNANTITNIHNPARLRGGDVVCVVPTWHRTNDQMGNPICPSDKQRFGPPYAAAASADTAMGA